MHKLVQQVQADYPDLLFKESSAFSWSPGKQTVSYHVTKSEDLMSWSLLHELAHALLDHRSYETDFELLLLEVAAWDKARELSNIYGVQIDEEHIQDCIDTYRDWLYQRSTCPTCTNTSLQQNAVTYSCFNCGGSWTVTASRFCRPYRLSNKSLKTSSDRSPAPTFR